MRNSILLIFTFAFLFTFTFYLFTSLLSLEL
jgi:hypothetical protein